MEQDDFKCPKCGCSHTTRIPVEFIGADTRKLWWATAFLLVLGVAVNPILLLLVLATAALSVIAGIFGKLRSRSVWDMQCSRCGFEFSVANPDAKLREKQKHDKQKQLADARLEKFKHRLADKEYNGQLLDGEQLLGEIPNIGYHKSAFSTTLYDVKCTNAGLLFCNAQGSFRVPAGNIRAIRKKNYFFFIPTGIQIAAVNEQGKRRNYNFVVSSAERESLITTLSTALPAEKRA